VAYARAVKNGDGGWSFQDLEAHLQGVARRAGAEGESFGCGELASLAGLWHDLGKYAADFQQYLLDANGIDSDREEAVSETVRGRVDHSAAGALYALDTLGQVGKILAQLIAAHHAGLYDAQRLANRLEERREAGRLKAAMAGGPPPSLLAQTLSTSLRIPGMPAPGAYALWLRLLFSCLVDADALDSEAYCDAASSRLRGALPRLDDLAPRLDAHLSGFVPDTPVKRIRAEILDDCLRAAERPVGLFTLTVPTGGGKTLSSMAFALRHARRWGLRRVIYVIPYTSIIEQTADVFRSIFGDAVVEHHSNYEGSRESAKARLAAENWDAPIIVTTSVQFFESLFAARTSRCRKLHNILRSVVVVDEAQLLPPDFLQPIADVIGLLTQHYPVSVVLSTATQPVLGSSQRFGESFRGLDHASEIVANPDDLYRRLKRVEVELPADLHAPITWSELAAGIAAEPCALAIVNRRKDARELHALLPAGAFHLSTSMCGAHRSDVLAEIRRRLRVQADVGQGPAPPLRVVSTQLVEAGVDVDFPVVFRALAGLDSIAQAAGRCNREGLLDSGRVHVFVSTEGSLPGSIRLGINASRSVLHGESHDCLGLGRVRAYFEAYYRDGDLDAQGICALLKPDASGGVVGLREAAQRFRLIEDEQTPVLVPYRRDAEDHRFDGLIAALRSEGPERGLMRKLQRYSVGVRPWEFRQLQELHEIEELFPGVWVLVSSAQYHPHLGLLLAPQERHDPLMV
jgi:CRISPR-associated endonuclease/helicase Cas3